MWDENSYIQEIKYYVAPAEFVWQTAGTSTIQNIEDDYEAQAEAGTIEMGSILGTNDFLLQAPPASFDLDCIHPTFQVKAGNFPSPCGWAEAFNSSNITTSFILDNSFPYPTRTSLISGFNYDGISSNFKWTEGYDFCYPSYALPKFFDYEGINAPMVQENLFHNFPAPWIRPFRLKEQLEDWKRLDPEYIGDTTIEVDSNSNAITITLGVKDRDLNREEYSQFVKNYWESQS